MLFLEFCFMKMYFNGPEFLNLIVGEAGIWLIQMWLYFIIKSFFFYLVNQSFNSTQWFVDFVDANQLDDPMKEAELQRSTQKHVCNSDVPFEFPSCEQ